MAKHLLLTLMMVAATATMAAYDFDEGGIFYKVNGTEATVTYETANNKSYTGDIIIPSEVTHEGVTYAVTAIGDSAFRNCTGMTSVVIPNSVKKLGRSSFLYCTGLTSIEIPNSVTSMGNHSFWGCNRLTSLSISNQLTYIGQQVFAYCQSLTSVVIPASVTSLGYNAFNDCTKLVTIEFPNTLVTIGDGAFLGCSALESIYIPKSVTSIGVSAFAQCFGLTSITVDAENTVFDSRGNCNAIIVTGSNRLITGCQNTVIPEGVVAIGEYSFSQCTGLTELLIPESVASIERSAFAQCNQLMKIVSKPVVPPSASNAFYQYGGSVVYGQAILFVPNASLDAYMTATEWSKFSHIVPFIGAGPGDMDGDGEIAIGDVTELIDLLLEGNELPAYCDVDGNGAVDISDVSFLIDILLGY